MYDLVAGLRVPRPASALCLIKWSDIDNFAPDSVDKSRGTLLLNGTKEATLKLASLSKVCAANTSSPSPRTRVRRHLLAEHARTPDHLFPHVSVCRQGGP